MVSQALPNQQLTPAAIDSWEIFNKSIDTTDALGYT